MNTRELTALFEKACKQRKLWPRFEEKWPSPVHRSGHFRPDCVIYKHYYEPVCAVEFKLYEITDRSKAGKQYKAYESMGIPWRYCTAGTLQDTLAWLDAVTST